MTSELFNFLYDLAVKFLTTALFFVLQPHAVEIMLKKRLPWLPQQYEQVMKHPIVDWRDLMVLQHLYIHQSLLQQSLLTLRFPLQLLLLVLGQFTDLQYTQTGWSERQYNTQWSFYTSITLFKWLLYLSVKCVPAQGAETLTHSVNIKNKISLDSFSTLKLL